MQVIEHQGVRLMTQGFGDPGHPPVLLVMGATASMLGWPDSLCERLAGEGLFVLRFDHRDTGQSTTAPAGNLDYAVEDMAGDVIAIMDGYGWDRAHLVGMSLGGLISQMVAVSHPARVASLTLIAAEPLGWDGEPLPDLPAAFMEHFAGLAELDWSNSAGVEAFLTESERLCAGEDGPFDQDGARALVRRVLERTESPASMFNHAMLDLREDWTGRFREITGSVLVIHGAADTIMPEVKGRSTHEGIAGSKLLIVPEMAHAIPPSAVAEITNAILTNVRGATG